MNMEDIIDALSSTVDGTLVMHKSIVDHSRFKVYKKICYHLYHIVNKNKELVLSYEVLENLPSDQMIEAWNKHDKKFLVELIKWIDSDYYRMRKHV